MPAALIFDLDGTLIDSCRICVDILSDMLAERGSGHCIDMAIARPAMSHGGERMVRALLGPACGEPAQELADFRARYAARTTPVSSLYPGVMAGLTRLADRGHRLAICSNKPQNLCENALADTGLAPLFTVVVGTRPGLRAKPAPDLLTETLRLLRAEAAECIFIGDSELDDAVARAAAMPFHFLTHGYADPAYRPDPGFAHDHFAGFAATLLAQAPGKQRKAGHG
ncbi:MAG: HAD hydrolase-like protein [Sphingomonadales bacterium]|nr:HAD hydrolase-like protein [Sphingomonadales bacterium]MDE2168852.1 HAD hydrolase-like protein [Sphingomonadales bacterium]